MLCGISWEPTGSLASLYITFLHQLTILGIGVMSALRHGLLPMADPALAACCSGQGAAGVARVPQQPRSCQCWVSMCRRQEPRGHHSPRWLCLVRAHLRPSVRWELKGCLALRDSAIMLWVVNISLSFLKAKWLLPPEKYINGPSKTLP